MEDELVAVREKALTIMREEAEGGGEPTTLYRRVAPVIVDLRELFVPDGSDLTFESVREATRTNKYHEEMQSILSEAAVHLERLGVSDVFSLRMQYHVVIEMRRRYTAGVERDEATRALRSAVRTLTKHGFTVRQIQALVRKEVA